MIDGVGAGAKSVAHGRYDVFLSYQSHQRDVVDELVHQLRRAGLNVFDPSLETVSLDEPWQTRLETARDWCGSFVVVLDNELSPWQESEIRSAVFAGKPVVPVLVGSDRIPDSINALDVIDLRGGITATGVEAVVREIRKKNAPSSRTRSFSQSSRLPWTLAATFGILLLALAGRYVSLSKPAHSLVSTRPSWSWHLRSHHLPHGAPVWVEGAVTAALLTSSPEFSADLTVLPRPGFIVGYFDSFKLPLWVARRWTFEDLQRCDAVNPKSQRLLFAADQDLLAAARGLPEYEDSAREHYDYTPLGDHYQNYAWGAEAVEAGQRMSNIVPMSDMASTSLWLPLAKQVRDIVGSAEFKNRGIDEIWVLSGSVFELDSNRGEIANGIRIPDAFYEIVSWKNSTGHWTAMAVLIPQDPESVNLSDYLVSVDVIEKQTGLDFFPEMEDAAEAEVERRVFTNLWQEP